MDEPKTGTREGLSHFQRDGEIRVAVSCDITNVSPQILHTGPLISVSLYIFL